MEKLIQSHPAIGFIISVALLFIGNTNTPSKAPHIPPIVMEVGQLIAWTAATVVALITVHGWYVKHFKTKPYDSTKKTPDKL